MTREEIEKAVEEFFEQTWGLVSNEHENEVSDLIGFALSCCARQAEEDERHVQYVESVEFLELEPKAKLKAIAHLDKIVKSIRANAPTCGELSRTKVDK